MAFAPLRQVFLIQKVIRSVAYTRYTCTTYTTLLKRPLTFKSNISLETLYPNSSLKLTTPSFSPDPNEKFSGYIPINKLEITYSGSSGPGGQNVNKVHTKVDVRFKLNEAEWLHPDIRTKLLEKHDTILTKEGYLVVRSDLTRSQHLNLADCMNKLRQMIRSAAHISKVPSADTLEKIRQRHLKSARVRLATKREASVKRTMKHPPTALDL